MSTLLAADAAPEKKGRACTSKTIPYKTSGTGSTTVLFIHGFMDAGNMWESVIQQMNSQKYRFVTLDLPFMGRLSESQREVSLDAMAEAVTGVVDELGKPIVLVGQSMGAQIAELVARARPGSIDSMVLVTPVPLTGLPVSNEFVATMQSMANNESMQLEYRRSFFPGLPEKELKKYARNGARIASHNITALISAWSKGHPAGLLPGPQGMPILIIGGAEDDACTPTVLKSLVAPRFAMSKTVFLPRARHWPHIEYPREIAVEIEQFLAADVRK
jgi:esterase